MFGIQPLPLNVPKREQECATSLAARLAYRNGVPRLITFCSDIGIRYLKLANGDNEEIRLLAAFAGLDPEALVRNTPSVIQKDLFRLGAANIKFSAFRRTKPRICPVCFSEHGPQDRQNAAYQTGLSQLMSVRTCIKHRCILQDLPKAPSNKDHFDAAQLGLGFIPGDIETVSRKDLELERYIRARIAGDPQQNWLDNVPFHVATQTAENFGILLLHGPDTKRRCVTQADWIKGGSIGFSFLKDGIDALIGKLDELEQKRPNDNSMYLKRFGIFFEWLRNRDDDPAFDVIRDPVRQFIFETYPVPKGAQVLGIENPKRVFHTHRTLAKERRLNPTKTCHALLKRGFMRKEPGKSFELLRYVPAGVADDVAHELNRVYSVSRTAEKLGITRPALDEFTKNGLIALHFQHQGAVPGYHSDEIWRFARAITANWQPYSKTEAAKTWVSFRDAAKRSKCSTWQVIQIVIKLNLPVANPDRNKKLVPDYLVCPHNVEMVFARAESKGIAFLQAARRLGCTTADIEQLIETGELMPIPSYAQRTRDKFRKVDEDSVARLLKTGLPA